LIQLQSVIGAKIKQKSVQGLKAKKAWGMYAGSIPESGIVRKIFIIALQYITEETCNCSITPGNRAPGYRLSPV